MTQDKVFLKFLNAIDVDPDIRKLTKSGRHAVDSFTFAEPSLHKRPGGRHFLHSARSERDTTFPDGDLPELLDVQVSAIQLNCHGGKVNGGND